MCGFMGACVYGQQVFNVCSAEGRGFFVERFDIKYKAYLICKIRFPFYLRHLLLLMLPII